MAKVSRSKPKGRASFKSRAEAAEKHLAELVSYLGRNFPRVAEAADLAMRLRGPFPRPTVSSDLPNSETRYCGSQVRGAICSHLLVGGKLECGKFGGCPDQRVKGPDGLVALPLKEEAKIPVEIVVARLEGLRREVNCRREHGADGEEHLRYVERKLTEIIDKTRKG
jgi:hypothetical protein